ncbi:MAG: rhodanese-like domain-containing protein [Bacilli bacterium]
MKNEISINEVLPIINKINIIDLRDPFSYNISHINNSKNISIKDILQSPDKYLNKANLYYMYCDFGKKSYELVKYLNRIGFDCISIIGGFNSYYKTVNQNNIS